MNDKHILTVPFDELAALLRLPKGVEIVAADNDAWRQQAAFLINCVPSPSRGAVVKPGEELVRVSLKDLREPI